MSEFDIILPVVSAVLAGLGWSLVGIWAKWRSGKVVDIDLGKTKKNVIIGIVVGAVAYGYASVYGDVTPVITSAQALFTAIASYFPIVILVDKLLIRHGEESEEEEFLEDEED